MSYFADVVVPEQKRGLHPVHFRIAGSNARELAV